MAKDPAADLGQWQYPLSEPWLPNFKELETNLTVSHIPTFERVIRYWAVKYPNQVDFVLRKEGWQDTQMNRPDQWYKVDDALKMQDGIERDQKLAQLKQEWPLFYQSCLDDMFCGM